MTEESVLTIGEFSGNYWWVDFCKKFVIVCVPGEHEPQAELDIQAQAAFLVYIPFFLWDQIHALNDADKMFQLWRAYDQLLTVAGQSWILF